MALPTRPGDVLAGRYRLIDLLSESGGGRFWRAHDRVLERYVALHVIPEEDPRAPGLVDAARASATVLDPRILRVLDAETRDGRCYVVNEWGTGTSLDLLLANNGPIGPRRAAWLVADVAGAIQRAHTAGVAHGRLNPENVLIDRFGAVRLIGFCVDAALHGLPGGRFEVDLGDLGGLLYAALTGAWPGPSTSLVTSAPRRHDEILSPRQVRAGVPGQLDELWRAIAEETDPQARRRHWLHRRTSGSPRLDVSTAQAVSEALVEFVGDPSGMPEALAATVLPINQVRPVDLPAVSDPVVRDVDPDPVPEVEPEPEPVTEETDLPEPGADPADSIPLVTDLPTEPGMPVFGDGEDVEWLRARSTPPPPPPPFEDPPERPLFAPDPPEGQPLRRPRTDVPAPPTTVRAPSEQPLDHPLDGRVATGEITGFWPWDHDAEMQRERDRPDEDQVPGRSWLRLGLGVLVALLLLFAVAIAFNLGRGRTPLGSKPDSSSSPSSSPSSVPAVPIRGVRATSFDPLGGGDENGIEAPRAVDGDPSTYWPTMTYLQQFGPGGLKKGVGLVLDLRDVHTVTDVDIRFVGAPTSVSMYVSDSRPVSAPAGAPLAHGTAASTRLTLTPTGDATDHGHTTGRYVLLWLTRLPPVPGGFRGEISEVVVHGH
ncbi:MAG: protein kinase family protein [Nocardioidaceae bacterium]|nr:protein kinase family protein [Nocardioidaceae bacterium]MCL2612760.1 protein kinase family protein [Nocardioidaceae bacterium]